MGAQVAADNCKEFYVQGILHAESSSGWVWCDPGSDLKKKLKLNESARTLVRIVNRRNRKSVVCECRLLDDYYVRTYDEVSRDKGYEFLQRANNPMIMSGWYRRALGIGDEGHREELSLERVGKYLGPIRAGAEHPDQIIRLATRLGVLSVWLGFDGLALGALSLVPDHRFWPATLVLIVMILSGFVLHRVVNRDI